MGRFLVKGFDQFGGLHCETAALRNVLAHRGLSVSEDMLLGLGGGVGFIYWYMKMMPSPIIGTRYGRKGACFVETICERLGVRATLSETSSAKKAYAQLTELLSGDEAAIVYGDMAYLPYFAIPEGIHFGGHVFVVCGVDEETDAVYVADRAKSPLVISTGDLARARGSKFPPFPPKHRLIAIRHPRRLSIGERVIDDAIRDCCDLMLHPPIKNIGIAGMRKWASIVQKWPTQFEGLELYGCLMNTYMFIEVSGTGGGAFRAMYSRFLDEAAGITGRPELAEAAEMFRRSAAAWKSIAVESMPDSHPILGEARVLIAEKNRLFEEQGQNALGPMLRINKEMEEVHRRVEAELGDVAGILSDMKEEITRCAAIEEEAFRLLGGMVGSQ